MGEPTPGRDSGPPGFLQLAGHPVRWRLLRELARSDRQVRELTSLTGHPQSLVSYHLGRLRAAQLVSARRSSADGRDVYYRADLFRCRELLGEAGISLHPGLSLAPTPPSTNFEALRTFIASRRPTFIWVSSKGESRPGRAIAARHPDGRVLAGQASGSAGWSTPRGCSSACS